MPKYSRNRPWVFRSGPYERPSGSVSTTAQQDTVISSGSLPTEKPTSAVAPKKGKKTASKSSAAIPPPKSTSGNDGAQDKSTKASQGVSGWDGMYTPQMGGILNAEHIRKNAEEWRKLPEKDLPPFLKGILKELESEPASTSKDSGLGGQTASSKTSGQKSGAQQAKSKTSTASRNALEDKSANVVPKKTATASEKQPAKSTSKGKAADSVKEKAEQTPPMTAEERKRIFKKNMHWEMYSGAQLDWDEDLSALAAEERRLEGHTLVLKGFAAEVADAEDDDETVIAKLKAAGGWWGHLTLRGEEDKTVPVYDTCIRLKEKIADFIKDIKKPENKCALWEDGKIKLVTLNKGAFCREIHTTTSSLNAFMKKPGVMGGAENGTYFNAYCFFEKKRMWDGAEKSEAREACEDVWWPKGLQLRDSNRSWSFIVPDGCDIYTYMDEDTGEVFFD